jgi:hypothetical protein
MGYWAAAGTAGRFISIKDERCSSGGHLSGQWISLYTRFFVHSLLEFRHTGAYDAAGIIVSCTGAYLLRFPATLTNGVITPIVERQARKLGETGWDRISPPASTSTKGHSGLSRFNTSLRECKRIALASAGWCVMQERSGN